jgi:nephrocystin-4
MMEVGLNLIDIRSGEGSCSGPCGGIVRKRQTAQVARSKGPVERRLMRMRNHRNGLYGSSSHRDESGAFEEDMESLALISWYREGQKRLAVRSTLMRSLASEYVLFSSFGKTLYFEHPLRNPFGHEERFKIEVDDAELRVVTNAEEWTYLRRHVTPCVGTVPRERVETDLLDVDPVHGIQITLLPNETVYIPFTLLSLSLRSMHAPRLTPAASSHDAVTSKGPNDEADASDACERSILVSFISASHGHIVSAMQVNVHRRAFPVHRTFRFYQAEGEVLKRCIQMLPYDAPPLIGKPTPAAASTGSDKFVHCVEECAGGRSGTNVVVEWRRRPQSRHQTSAQELLLKYRVGAFPLAGEFYILLYNDAHHAQLYEVWHVVVQARLRLNVHAALGQTTPTDIVVRGDDRHARRVQCFTSSPKDVIFDPPGIFQLTAGAYNRCELLFRPRSAGIRRVQVHMVDVDTHEIVGAWLATATALAPVITKTYDVDVPVGKALHKRITFENTWGRPRIFNLSSSDDSLVAPRYEKLPIAAGGSGFIRLWMQAPDETGNAEVFVFVNDEEDQNEECLLMRLRFI